MSESNPSTKIIIGQDEPFIKAIQSLEFCKSSIGALIVVKDEESLEVVGMLSDGDIRRFFLKKYKDEGSQELNLATIQVKEVMNENITKVSRSEPKSWFSKIGGARDENKERRIRIVPIVEDGRLAGILDLVATKDRSRLDAMLMEMAYPTKQGENSDWLTGERVKKRREDYDSHHIKSQFKKYEALAHLDKREMMAMIQNNRIDALYTAFKRGSDWAKNFPGPNNGFKKKLNGLADDLDCTKNALLLLYIADKIIHSEQGYLENIKSKKGMNILCVLGCANSAERKSRVQESMRILQIMLDNNTPPRAIVLSGGGTDGNKTESEIMKKIIEEETVGNKTINEFLKNQPVFEETDSLDTVGNAVFSTLMLLQKNILVLGKDKLTFKGKNEEDVCVWVVTSHYHAPRAYNLFNRIFKSEQIKICMAPTITDIQKNVERANKQFDSEFKANSDTFALENVLTGLSNSIADGEVFSVFFQILRGCIRD